MIGATRHLGHQTSDIKGPQTLRPNQPFRPRPKGGGGGEGGGSDLDRLFPDFLHGLPYELLVLVVFVKPAEEVRGFLLHVQRPLLASLPQEGGKRERVLHEHVQPVCGMSAWAKSDVALLVWCNRAKRKCSPSAGSICLYRHQPISCRSSRGKRVAHVGARYLLLSLLSFLARQRSGFEWHVPFHMTLANAPTWHVQRDSPRWLA